MIDKLGKPAPVQSSDDAYRAALKGAKTGAAPVAEKSDKPDAGATLMRRLLPARLQRKESDK